MSAVRSKKRRHQKGKKSLVKFCSIVSKENHFCIALLLVMKSGFILTIPSKKKSWVNLSQPSTSQPVHNIYGKKALLCMWWDQKGTVYYELLKPGETVIGDHY